MLLYKLTLDTTNLLGHLVSYSRNLRMSLFNIPVLLAAVTLFFLEMFYSHQIII